MRRSRGSGCPDPALIRRGSSLDSPQNTHLDVVTILRLLWRLRRLVAVLGFVSIAVGLLTAVRPGLPPHSRQYTVGVASGRVLIDTPHSQVVDLGLTENTNAGVLPARAVLLANLLTTSPLREETAQRSGVPSNRLAAVADLTATSGAATPGAAPAGTPAVNDRRGAYVLKAATDMSLPLITLTAQAPTPAAAARLVNSAIAVLDKHVISLSNQQAVPAGRRLVVKPLGAARAGTETRGPSRTLAIALTLVLFTIGCAFLVVASLVAGRWRAAVADEDFEAYAAWEALEIDADGEGDAAAAPRPATSSSRRDIAV